jgi:hypothetical protein
LRTTATDSAPDRYSDRHPEDERAAVGVDTGARIVYETPGVDSVVGRLHSPVVAE